MVQGVKLFILKKTIIFLGSRGGSTFFRGRGVGRGSSFFLGEGVQLLKQTSSFVASSLIWGEEKLVLMFQLLTLFILVSFIHELISDLYQN